MAYNNKNKIETIRKVHQIVQIHYVEGVTTYKGIWSEYVNKTYPMSYATFLKYINTPVPKVHEVKL
jgi:hypothetical protein